MTVNTWPLDAVSGAPSYSGRMLRQTTVAPFTLMGNAARPLGAMSGVRWGTATTTVSATTTTWTCNPHVGVIDGETAAQAGPYAYSVDANVTGALTAQDGSNPRVDIVYAQISDPAEGDGSTTPQVQILYLAGTAAATPVAPATPARSSVLTQLNVPKAGGGSPSATWVAPWLSGSRVGFQTYAQLLAWSPAPFGQHATVLNDAVAGNNADFISTGSNWLGGVSSGTFAPGTGFVAGTGAQVPRILRGGIVRTLFGTYAYGSGSNYSSVLTLAAVDQPPTTTQRSIGTVMVQPSSGSGVVAEAFLTAGVVSLGVSTASTPAGTVHLAGLTWAMD